MESRGKSFEGNYALFWKHWISMLDEIHLDDILIVIYLRRQDDFITSSWKQSMKTGHSEIDFEAFCQTPIRLFPMDYAVHVRYMVEQVFSSLAYADRLSEGKSALMLPLFVG